MKIIISTCPEKKADGLVNTLLEERLIACANVINGVSSRYWWKGKIECDTESLLILKTADQLTGRVISRITELHSYEAPEAVVLDVEQGNPDYLRWVDEVTG